MNAFKLASGICLMLLISIAPGCGSDDDPAAPPGGGNNPPPGPATPQFLLTWGSPCWLGANPATDTLCVDPDGPGGPLERGDGQFGGATGIAVDGSGNVYVMDMLNGRLQKFDSDGNLLTKLEGFGFLANLTVDASGNVFVVDATSHSVQKFSSTWTPLGTVGGHCDMSDGTDCEDRDGPGRLELGDGQFDFPVGVAVDAAGNIYVADTGNDRIQKFVSGGAFITKWGANGENDGEFKGPQGMAIDGSGNLYVVDWANHRIQKFDLDGNFLGKWGSQGSGDGQFDFPQDVAVDADGNVYVTDSDNNRVQKFDSSGNFLTKWGTFGEGDGQFDGLVGIAVDASGNIYTAEAGQTQDRPTNMRVQKFK